VGVLAAQKSGLNIEVIITQDSTVITIIDSSMCKVQRQLKKKTEHLWKELMIYAKIRRQGFHLGSNEKRNKPSKNI